MAVGTSQGENQLVGGVGWRYGKEPGMGGGAVVVGVISTDWWRVRCIGKLGGGGGGSGEEVGGGDGVSAVCGWASER